MRLLKCDENKFELFAKLEKILSLLFENKMPLLKTGLRVYIGNSYILDS